jgi:diaminopimelate epimerase
MRTWSFAKGHGTENDFVLLLDREGILPLGEPEVRYLCDRHAGIGGDGVLRAVRAGRMPGWSGEPDLWFMDYRNADGSIAEMCGNGIRVFARFLLEQDLAYGPTLTVATRAGAKEVAVLPDGRIRVAMGPARLTGLQVSISTADSVTYPALSVDVGNPHAVSFADALEDVPLHAEPTWQPPDAFPHGVNREFVTFTGERHIAMRVFERGSGETRSCGTGTVAAALAARAHAVDKAPLPVTYRVDVPGGSVEVELHAEETYLTGPAVLVAHGEVTMPV